MLFVDLKQNSALVCRPNVFVLGKHTILYAYSRGVFFSTFFCLLPQDFARDVYQQRERPRERVVVTDWCGVCVYRKPKKREPGAQRSRPFENRLASFDSFDLEG